MTRRCNKRIWILLVLMLGLSACMIPIVYWRFVEGQILVEGTHAPIEGAIVVGLYKGGAAYSNTVCFHVESAVTDSEGRYTLSSFSNWGEDMLLTDQELLITVYKEGYEWASTPRDQSQKIRYLKPFTGSREERLKYLQRATSGGCSLDVGENKKLVPLNRAIFDEANRIAKTNADQKVVNSIRMDLDWVELGPEEAHRKRY